MHQLSECALMMRPSQIPPHHLTWVKTFFAVVTYFATAVQVHLRQYKRNENNRLFFPTNLGVCEPTVGKKEVLKTGTQIANDLLQYQNLKEAAKLLARETGKKLAKEAIKTADDMFGQGKNIKEIEDSKNIIPVKSQKAKTRV
ncbi:hypothetical protein NPIL_215301 [Nephila pilipes]|uniref:Uncharacterized protein n=1 Tax=Nephila pilipes TaxID=299642 RepID=A0A8X6P093_NEPPI|nr:hypothetical protein NPIL_215301 [Nephila pilipes]